ncbi:exported hypothetical protein [metagenome]|uniref:Uncharacterized protein n=1 Tax=metagenome TaxID=256318 RepID=A0A2P2CA51_9ZZZZ
MMKRTPLRLALGVAVSGLLLLTYVTSLSAEAATGSDAVWLPLNGSSGVAVKVNNAGSSVTVQRVVSEDGGSLTFASSYATAGNALRYPAYDGDPAAPRAVVGVTNAGDTDGLTPRGRAFTIGADVRLARVNNGTPYDNGNNVIQRGLYDEASQFKIQVDDGRASCRIKGLSGETMLTSGRAIATGAWYRLTCRRINRDGPDRFRLVVRPIASDGSLGVATKVSSTTTVGRLSFPVSTPMSLGGKLGNDLVIVAASDQFNGKLDNAFFRLD